MQNYTNTKSDEAQLLRIEPCRLEVFKDEDSRPSARTWKEWKRRGYFPQIKIGGIVYLDPVEVKRALVKRFTINAKEIV